MSQIYDLWKQFQFIVIWSKIIKHTSKVSFTFVLNKELGKIMSISPHALTLMKTIHTVFASVEVWFTDQASDALEVEGKLNLTLTIE